MFQKRYKHPVKRQTSENEQVIIPIPAIVTKELAEKANRRVAANKQLAARNNQTSKESLLQDGFARCAYRKCSLRVDRIIRTHASGEEVAQFHYDCSNTNLKGGKCSGCFISVDLLDRAVAEYIVEFMRDPSVVDKKRQKLLADSPISKRQQQENLERRIITFHEQCAETREPLDDPQFIPSFSFQREALFFFGISVTVWRSGTKPRYEIRTDPPEMKELLSKWISRPPHS
jgi:hypothetical protein